MGANGSGTRAAWVAAGLAWAAAGTWAAQPLTVDHRHVDVARLTTAQIERAKERLHIAYGHTSHGSQITDGMGGLVGFANGGGKGMAHPQDVFAWNNGGHGGALDLHDGAMGGDVGYYPDWVNYTTAYLDDPANADVNVVMWSWCGQMSGKHAAGTLTNEYLRPMSELEASYPHVTFVYMTGHVDIWDDANQKGACEAIRAYCRANGKVLYDFADIEHWDPDGTYHEYVNDDCAIHDGPGGTETGNWALAWQATHEEGVDWYSCGSAHSEPLNANQKAYAAWALWCALAADMDRDGLGDEWEERHGGTQMFGEGTNNCDGDAHADWEEYVLGTNPTNAEPRFAVSGCAAEGVAGARVATETGRTYRLDVREDLEDGEWREVASREGTGGAMDLEDPAPPAGAGALAYRVAVTLT